MTVCSFFCNFAFVISVTCSRDFFCVCMRSIVLTSEGLYALSFATGSCCNFAFVISVTCSGDLFCVRVTTAASEGLYALGFATGSCCNFAFIRMCMAKVRNYSIFSVATNGAVTMLCTVFCICSSLVYDPIAPCMLACCGNFFLSNESFATNGALLTVCKTCILTCGSLAGDNFFGMSERLTVFFAARFANRTGRTSRCSTLVRNPFCVNYCVVFYFVGIKVPRTCAFSILVPTCKFESISCRILRSCNKIAFLNVL